MSDDKKRRIGDMEGQLSFDSEAFKKAFEKLTPPIASNFSFVMSRAAEEQVRRQIELNREMLEQEIDSPIVGHPISIYGSDRVPDDTVWMMETVTSRYQRPLELPTDWDETVYRIRFNFRLGLESMLWYGDKPLPAVKVYEWRRLAYESLEGWGARLHASGAIDVPEVRWAYQRAVMSAPWRWLRDKLGR